jgi:hypothetical protein
MQEGSPHANQGSHKLRNSYRLLASMLEASVIIIAAILEPVVSCSLRVETCASLCREEGEIRNCAAVLQPGSC